MQAEVKAVAAQTMLTVVPQGLLYAPHAIPPRNCRIVANAGKLTAILTPVKIVTKTSTSRKALKTTLGRVDGDDDGRHYEGMSPQEAVAWEAAYYEYCIGLGS